MPFIDHATSPPEPGEREPIDYYVKLKERGEDVRAYQEWINDYLGVELTDTQMEMLEAFCRNQKTLIVGANGFGKTYFIAALSLAFFCINFPSVVMATSGTFGKMQRTYCKPVRNFHESTWGLPGKYLKSSTTIRVDGYPEVYWSASSPGDPGELEGVHSDYLMAVIEEADKQGVTEDVFDSMESLLTDRRDKIIATANPPKDEGDVVNKLMNDDTWATETFSSFDAANVQVELNADDPYQTDDDGEVIVEDGWPLLKPETEDRMVDGIVRLRQIKNDWESWNRTEWPGIEEAMMSGEREDLDVRWYRRRLGQKPPELAVVHRPYTVEDVRDAWNRDPARVTATPDGIGFDVARGTGDYNCVAAVFGRQIEILDRWHLGDGETHVDSESYVRDLIEGSWDCRFAIDAVGEGSGISDMIMEWYPNVHRFNNGSNAIQSDKYDNKWTESNAEFGQLLRDGGGFTDKRLREEVLAASRALEYEVSFSRGRDADVLRLNSKGDVKDRLGRSPDVLDAALMAAWAASGDTYSGPREIPSSW
jgi:hypothetical protein